MIEMNDIKIKNNDKLLFIHHWDCDGLCSAALLYKFLNKINQNIKIKMMTPEIGNYFLSGTYLRKIKIVDPDHLFVIDMALPEKDILILKNIIKNIYIFDHHKQSRIKNVFHINPTADGKTNKSYPSTGWVLNDYINHK